MPFVSLQENYFKKILSLSLPDVKQQVIKDQNSGFRYWKCPVIQKYLQGKDLSFTECESICNSFIIDCSKQGKWFKTHVLSPKFYELGTSADGN
jgi:hypothetical protein